MLRGRGSWETPWERKDLSSEPMMFVPRVAEGPGCLGTGKYSWLVTNKEVQDGNLTTVWMLSDVWETLPNMVPGLSSSVYPKEQDVTIQKNISACCLTISYAHRDIHMLAHSSMAL